MTERPLNEAIGARLDVLCADHAETVLGRGEVFDALSRLSAGQREVLVLRFYGDLLVRQRFSW